MSSHEQPPRPGTRARFTLFYFPLSLRSYPAAGYLRKDCFGPPHHQGRGLGRRRGQGRRAVCVRLHAARLGLGGGRVAPTVPLGRPLFAAKEWMRGNEGTGARKMHREGVREATTTRCDGGTKATQRCQYLRGWKNQEKKGAHSWGTGRLCSSVRSEQRGGTREVVTTWSRPRPRRRGGRTCLCGKGRKAAGVVVVFSGSAPNLESSRHRTDTGIGSGSYLAMALPYP